MGIKLDEAEKQERVQKAIGNAFTGYFGMTLASIGAFISSFVRAYADAIGQLMRILKAWGMNYMKINYLYNQNMMVLQQHLAWWTVNTKI